MTPDLPSGWPPSREHSRREPRPLEERSVRGELRRRGWEDVLPNALWSAYTAIWYGATRGERVTQDTVWRWVNYAPGEEYRRWRDAGGRALFETGRWPLDEPPRVDPDLRRETFRSLLGLPEDEDLVTLDDGLVWLQEHGLARVAEYGWLEPSGTLRSVRDVFDVEPPAQDDLLEFLWTAAERDIALIDFTSNELIHEALVESLAAGTVHGLWVPTTPAMQVTRLWPFHLQPPVTAPRTADPDSG